VGSHSARVQRVVHGSIVAVTQLIDDGRREDVNPRSAEILIPPGDEVGEVRVVARCDQIGHIVVGIPPEDFVLLAEVMIHADKDLIVIG